MKTEDLAREFANRCVPHSGGLLLLAADDALAFVERAASENLPVLGIDGFSLAQDQTESLIENIADFSAAVLAGNGCWQDAATFIQEHRGGGLVFEIVLGDEHMLPNKALDGREETSKVTGAPHPPSPYGTPVAEGTWLYAGTVTTKVRVLRSEATFGTGDYEDEPEDADDRPGLCFYVEWEPAGGGPGGSLTGPFPTVEEAKAHVHKSAETVHWGAPIEDS
jgi:hypothetical protein